MNRGLRGSVPGPIGAPRTPPTFVPDSAVPWTLYFGDLRDGGPTGDRGVPETSVVGSALCSPDPGRREEQVSPHSHSLTGKTRETGQQPRRGRSRTLPTRCLNCGTEYCPRNPRSTRVDTLSPRSGSSRSSRQLGTKRSFQYWVSGPGFSHRGGTSHPGAGRLGDKSSPVTDLTLTPQLVTFSVPTTPQSHLCTWEDARLWSHTHCTAWVPITTRR